KNAASSTTIHTRVVAAFFDAGDLKTMTPFEIASVPVMAEHPSANARNSRIAKAKPIGGAVGGTGGATGGWPTERITPAMINANIMKMNAYVGRRNAAPDSRTPRKLTTIRRSVASTQSSTRRPPITGYVEMMASIPDAMDTDTVRM